MKKTVAILIFLLSTLVSSAQIDTIIKTPILESYFSYKYHNPLYVKYKLYHGGGECSRSKEGFHFYVDTIPNGGKSKKTFLFSKKFSYII